MIKYSKKLILNSVLSISTALLLTACGGGNGDGGSGKKNDDNKTDPKLDTVAPKITINGNKNISLVVGDIYAEFNATASDNIDGNLTNKIVINGNVNTASEGNYTIGYSVSDKAGNSATATRIISVESVAKFASDMIRNIPIDSNIEYGNEPGVLYYADPYDTDANKSIQDNKRVLRIDYANMNYTEKSILGLNPHSIDRAGDSKKFYIRTQNSYSFDVVNFETGAVNTIPLSATDKDGNITKYKPRAIGAYNHKHKLQLISGKNAPVVGVIDTTTDTVIKTVGYSKKEYDKKDIVANAGNGSATGHAIWLDEDHFALIDRVSKVIGNEMSKPHIYVYRVNDSDGSRNFTFTMTHNRPVSTSIHVIERVRNPKTRKDLVTFYSLGEGIVDGNETGLFAPFITELIFDPKNGYLKVGKNSDATKTERKEWLTYSDTIIDGIKPTTHHGGITPDGKYFVIPLFDGKLYFIDRVDMQTKKIIDTIGVNHEGLGAAHIEFSKQLKKAVITNHFSNYITVVDMNHADVNNYTYSYIKISEHPFDPSNKHLLQPHFSYIGKDGKYFYTFATHDGDFLKIDLETKAIEILHVGGTPEQAHS